MINKTIRDFVAENAPSLVEFNTGGGIDYFGRTLQTGYQVIVCAVDEAGSPDTLDDEANLMIWTDESWEEWITLYFPKASDAYIACHNMEADSI